MLEWRLRRTLHVLTLGLTLGLGLAYEEDIDINYTDPFYNEITEGDSTEPTPSPAPCTTPDLTKWDKMFSMLENSQMRENMLLQYADNIIKVEMDSLRQEMLQFVVQYSSSCAAAVEAAGGRLALQLDTRFEETLDRLKARDDQSAKPLAVQQEAVLQQLLTTAQSQASRLMKMESSCFSGAHSKTGFRWLAGHQEQEVASNKGHLEAELATLQQSRAEFQEALQSLTQKFPAGCDMALLFPMRSSRIYTSVDPEMPLSLSAFTACLWAKPSAISNKTVLLSYGHQQNPYEIQLLLGRGSVLFTVGGEAHLVEAGLDLRGPSQWVHLCGAWSSQQGLASLWAGGRRAVVTPGVAEGHMIPPGGSLQLGQERNGCCPLTPGVGRGMAGFQQGFDSKLAFAGKMTGVNVWDRVLSAQEIALLGQRDGHSCEEQRGNLVAWGVTEMVPHGGAQFIY